MTSPSELEARIAKLKAEVEAYNGVPLTAAWSACYENVKLWARVKELEASLFEADDANTELRLTVSKLRTRVEPLREVELALCGYDRYPGSSHGTKMALKRIVDALDAARKGGA